MSNPKGFLIFADGPDCSVIIVYPICTMPLISSWVAFARRLQELRVVLAKSKESLTATLGRAPTVQELAAHLNLTDEVLTLTSAVTADHLPSESSQGCLASGFRAGGGRVGGGGRGGGRAT
ncbi:sigma-70 domain-containing protein, partial [Streptomyces mirabilis]|uniref:sigma-70 domain-containing protein n=1 Tax=Streptomyces mirabilis TaxID=68239 RepID=UPI00369111AB